MADLISMLAAAAGASAEAGDYQISRSLRFNSADSAYLSRTPASAGNRKTFTVSCWAKRTTLGAGQFLWEGGSPDGVSTRLFCRFEADDTLRVATGGSIVLNTTQVFRDVSSWYHIVVAIDTPNATLANRAKLYVNGVEVTAFSSASYFGLNDDTGWNMAQAHSIGRTHIDAGNYFNGYITEFYNIDGQALTPTSFGEFNATTGVWSPIRYAGSYGTNGFYLNFSDNTSTTTLGEDQAGSNDWTLNNFSVTAGAGNDSLVDSPTRYGDDTGAGGEVRGNYCTLNPLNLGASATLANGNLDHASTAASWTTALSTIGMTSGKWYFEATMTSSGEHMVGIANSAFTTSTWLGGNINSWSYYSSGVKYTNGGSSSYGASYTNGDVIGVALDMDAGTVVFYKNGSSQGTAFSSLTGPLFFGVSGISSTTRVVNFGQRPFAYTAPSGFKALVTTNLPEPTVVQGDDHFSATTYTGTGSSGLVVTTGLASGLVWIKDRQDANHHVLFDQVRGINKTLASSLTNSEYTLTAGSGLLSFDSTGFTLGTETSGAGSTNASSRPYISWNWKANGAGVSNTDGSITSTVSASIDSGFSIITYTGNGSAGATVGHGLGAVPKMFILKERNGSSAADFWATYHVSLGNTKYLTLNTTNAEATAAYWNNTTPSSSVITLGSNTNINDSGGPIYLIYAFAEVEGFSKFGSYTGNGSADGPFVYTGFRPAFVMIKGTSAGYIWTIEDNKRDTFNPETKYLQPQASAAEGTFTTQDFTSNGFKIRTADTAWNGSGITYIYMAFAESPFKFALGR